MRKQGHPLIVVAVVLIIRAAVHFNWWVGDDTVGRGVEQPSSLFWHQQGRSVLNTAAFLHIVHLQQAGKNRRNRLSKHKQTSQALTKTTPHYRLSSWFVSLTLYTRDKKYGKWACNWTEQLNSSVKWGLSAWKGHENKNKEWLKANWKNKSNINHE